MWAGFIHFRNLMRGREAVVDVWLATINGGGKQMLILLLMEVHWLMIRLMVIYWLVFWGYFPTCTVSHLIWLKIPYGFFLFDPRIFACFAPGVVLFAVTLVCLSPCEYDDRSLNFSFFVHSYLPILALVRMKCQLLRLYESTCLPLLELMVGRRNEFKLNVIFFYFI